MLCTNKMIIKFLSLLLSVLLIGQCFQVTAHAKGIKKHSKKSSKLLLRSAKINGSVINKSKNILVIKNAVDLSNIVYIKHIKKNKRKKGLGIPLQATLNGCDLEINLEKIAPISFLPNGKYIVTATRGDKKIRAKFRLRSPKLAGGLFRVFKNPNVKLTSTLRQQLISSNSTTTGGLASTGTISSSSGEIISATANEEIIIRTFDYKDPTVEITPPTVTSLAEVSTNNGITIQKNDFVTEFYPDQAGIVTGEISENGTNFELSAIISNDYNDNASTSSSGNVSNNSEVEAGSDLQVKASDLYTEADITLSSTYLAEAAKAIETFIKAKDPNADFSAGIFVAEANEESTVSVIDTAPSLLQGSTSANVVFAINSNALLDAAAKATTSTKLDNNDLVEVITKLPNLIVENNLIQLEDPKVIEDATVDPIAVGFLSSDSVSKETAKELLTETGVIPGFFEQISKEQLTTIINTEGALPLLEVNDTLSTDLKNVVGSDTNVTIVIPAGTKLNTDVVTNLSGITVIADGGSVISGSKNPGVTISVTPGTLVESTATSFVKATEDVSNPILNNTVDIPGLIPSEDLYGIPTSYDVDLNARVVASDGTLKDAELITIPTSLEAQIAVSTSSTSTSGNTTSSSSSGATSSSSSESSSGITVSSSSATPTGGGTTTIVTIPVFNPSNSTQVQQLETALTKDPKVITGAGAAPLLIVFGDKNISKNLISILSMAVDIASITFPPIDESKVISITADPESIINGIQQALGILAGSESGSTSSTSSSGSTSTSGGSISSTGGSTSTSGGTTTNNPSLGSVGNFFNNLGTVDISATTNSDNNTPVTQSVVTKDDLAEEPLCRLLPQ